MNVSFFPELLNLHGYGIYVWPAYAAMLAALLMEPWLVHRRLERARDAAREHWQTTQFDAADPAGWSDTHPPEDAR